MTRIFLDETQLEELNSFDIYEDLNDIFDDDAIDQFSLFDADDSEI